ncbi:MAG: cell division protein FtsK [Ignavibacteria bacterium RIFOXYB2_FULL_35_12]|nr:MAG: cell division protein FtsK [Ignavibacteria bacterium GWA2_36_19]OGU55706.1 MAG: cell division protein FtsK [Ignavibacteria bacterium GWC2_35_8]OGU62404.1 MAG: cell division protein FtsK [Ignavibacteria bacterium GWF2_35_20]OGU81947.1 MAG: cell division protein FtsK [Ignavibacteria bacterium RIFOXYA2_FULL_35_9]OGU86279.1 MAG: cell division protein FtsK [Ignavibacteria bacterium RIFOXYA12_FULL_35_25]OGU92157.1 MAG: cell division protein FtsK [Ignavibacteria bacterium RIFOXYC12_FULL_35_11
MALRRKTKTQSSSSKEDGFFSFTNEKKKIIIGILLLIFSLFLFFSIISFHEGDVFGSFFSDLVNGQIKNPANWLGVIGAHFSNFLVKYSLGYFSIAFPVILFFWGIAFFKKIKFRTIIYTSNFILLAAIILASLFGIMNTSREFPLFPNFSGYTGDYFGKVLKRLFGGIGSVIFLITSFVLLIIIAFNVKIESIVSFLKSIFMFTSSASKEASVDKKSSVGIDENLEKIKDLRPEKKKRRIIHQEEALAKDESELEDEETKIRIIRKDEKTTLPIETNELLNEEIKKVDLEKTGDIPPRETTAVQEAKLPNQWDEILNFKKPSLELLDPVVDEDYKVAEEELKRNAEQLKEKLKLFDISIQDISVTPGPVVTLYEIVPEPGVKISRIVGLENDIALALAARGIRIIAPIPGKSAIGVEIPNAEASVVNARSVVGKIFDSKAELPMAFGKTISGDVYVTDLSKMPHLLIAGSTGSGKSVGINMIVASLLYAKDPSDVKFIMIDPKKIELSFYNKLRKHYLAVSPDLEEEIITSPQNAVLLLKSVEYEMEQRYDRLAKAGVRNIVDYNLKVADVNKKPKDTDEIKHHHLPYLIVIIDELADLMITAGKDVEEPITRLAQLARAVGIHLVLATQRPSVNVITGVIKANFSSRIAYQVATKIDSRTILDMNGAEQLLGKGDMLFLPTGSPKPIRVQNAFISTDEVEKLTNYIYSQPGYSKPYFLPSLYEKKKAASGKYLSDLDPMFEEAARVIVRHQQGSVSLLQRRLKLGYSRAARIVDQLEEAGIVGPNDGSKARSVIVESEEQLETILRNL